MIFHSKVSNLKSKRMNETFLPKQVQLTGKKNLRIVINEQSPVAQISQELDFPRANSLQSSIQNIPLSKAQGREDDLISKKSYVGNAMLRPEQAPKKMIDPEERRRLKRIIKNYNEFVKLLDRDENRKAHILENLEQKIMDLKENISRIYKGEAQEQDSNISFLNSCKNFNLDVSTVSQMLKQHKFKFESEKSDDEDNDQTIDGGRSGKRLKKKKEVPASSPGDLLTYFMLFKLIGQKTDKPNASTSNLNAKQLMDLEDKLREQNARMAEVIQAKQKTPFPILPLLKSPKIDNNPSFHASVMDKLNNIQARLSQSHNLSKYSRESLKVKESTKFPLKRDFTQKYRRIHEHMMMGMQHNLLGLDRNLQKHIGQARAHPAYLPIPLR